MLYGLTQFLPENALSVYDILEFMIRIVLSGVLGVVIGLERSHRQKEAGTRTHCIIAVASALFMILSKYCFLDVVELGAVGGKGVDPSRIASQVVSGISFLGAGVIFKQGKVTIKGLTTAAGMWATSAVGMAIGAGLYWMGIFTSLVMVLIQIVLHKHPVGHDAQTMQEVTISLMDDPATRAAFDALLQKHKGKIEESDIRREGEQLHMRLSVRVEEPISHAEILQLLEENGEIYHICV